MYFDGEFSRDGVGDRIVLISCHKKNITHSFKLDFEVTRNVEKYESLILALELSKCLKVELLAIYGDSELIVKQIINLCQTKHPRLRDYRKEVWYYADNYFQAFNITSISGEENIHADALVIFVSYFKIPDPL